MYIGWGSWIPADRASVRRYGSARSFLFGDAIIQSRNGWVSGLIDCVGVRVPHDDVKDLLSAEFRFSLERTFIRSARERNETHATTYTAHFVETPH
jgi:hypothetical protein